MRCARSAPSRSPICRSRRARFYTRSVGSSGDMFTATKRKALLTTTTGALPRPSWYTANLRGTPLSYGLSQAAYREQHFDCLACNVVAQHRAGIDIFVDGDARLDDDVAGRSWVSYATERIAGIGKPRVEVPPAHFMADKGPGDLMWEVIETRMTPPVEGPIGTTTLELDRAYKAMATMTDRPVKIGSISAHIVQIEEPAIHQVIADPNASIAPAQWVEAFNAEVAGLRGKCEVWCHTCWGSPAAQRVASRDQSYKDALPYFDQLDVDVITFEGAFNHGLDFEHIGRMISKDKKVALGVISHRTLQVERPEEVAQLIRLALRYIEPERLILSSDCGFGRQSMSRMHAYYKMLALVRGTNMVRRELGLAEAYIPGADPRLSMITLA